MWKMRFRRRLPITPLRRNTGRAPDEIDKHFLVNRARKLPQIHSSVRLRCEPFFRRGPPILPPLPTGAVKAGRICRHRKPPQALALTGPSTATRWRGRGPVIAPGTCHQWRLSLAGAGDLVTKRGAWAASVTELPNLSCRAEAPARTVFWPSRFPLRHEALVALAPPGRQSSSRGRAAP